MIILFIWKFCICLFSYASECIEIDNESSAGMMVVCYILKFSGYKCKTNRLGINQNRQNISNKGKWILDMEYLSGNTSSWTSKL